MKRETSLSVTDLHERELSDSVKRLALREGDSSLSSAPGSPSSRGSTRAPTPSLEPSGVLASGSPLPTPSTFLSPANSPVRADSTSPGGSSGASYISSELLSNPLPPHQRFPPPLTIQVPPLLDPALMPLVQSSPTHSLSGGGGGGGGGGGVTANGRTFSQGGTVLDAICERDAFEKKYELGSEIGRGGFSVVCQCRDRLTRQEFAVKMVDLRPLRLRERFNPARLRREVDIMKRLQHPSIVKFIEGFETESQLLMVMELCPGEELFDVILARQSFQEADAKPVFAQVTRALYYLHCLNIIHRDVSISHSVTTLLLLLLLLLCRCLLSPLPRLTRPP